MERGSYRPCSDPETPGTSPLRMWPHKAACAWGRAERGTGALAAPVTGPPQGWGWGDFRSVPAESCQLSHPEIQASQDFLNIS